jgi:alkylation response protein AidB-like acyl-CoA dehydrogenase
MNFELSQEQKILQRSVREFCARAISPHAARWNEQARFPMEVIEPIAQLGLLGIHIPERYGGAGMGLLDLCVAVEELSRADASLGLTVASHNLRLVPNRAWFGLGCGGGPHARGQA